MEIASVSYVVMTFHFNNGPQRKKFGGLCIESTFHSKYYSFDQKRIKLRYLKTNQKKKYVMGRGIKQAKNA